MTAARSPFSKPRKAQALDLGITGLRFMRSSCKGDISHVGLRNASARNFFALTWMPRAPETTVYVSRNRNPSRRISFQSNYRPRGLEEALWFFRPQTLQDLKP